MVVTVFRSRLLSENQVEFRELAGRMLALAEKMPGFVSYKVYVAEDGERCSVIEFESAAHLEAWRRHPEHVAAMETGRKRFYREYTSLVGEPARESRFVR